MLKTVWNKEEFKKNILSKKGEFRLLDFWMPVQVYVNNIDLSGLEFNPGGEITQIDDLFLNLFYIFKSIDPTKLSEKDFYYDFNEENCVSGGGFSIYAFLDQELDILRLKYYNFTFPLGEFHSTQILLKDFAKGLLLSTKELLDDLISINPVYKDDEEYKILEENMETLGSWYKDRYHEDVLQDTHKGCPYVFS